MFSYFERSFRDGNGRNRVGWAITFTNAAVFVGLTGGAALFPLSAAAEEEVLEEVLVTGSRIQRGNLTQPNPVTAWTRMTSSSPAR